MPERIMRLIAANGFAKESGFLRISPHCSVQGDDRTTLDLNYEITVSGPEKKENKHHDDNDGVIASLNFYRLSSNLPNAFD